MFSCCHSYCFIAIKHLKLSFHLQYFNCHYPLFSADVPTMILFMTLFGVVFRHPHVHCLVATTHFVQLLQPILFAPLLTYDTSLSSSMFKEIIRCHQVGCTVTHFYRFHPPTIYDCQFPYLVYCYHPHSSVDAFSHCVLLITILIVQVIIWQIFIL